MALRSPDLVPERVSWQDFVSRRFVWRQGEHVVILGTVGAGKSTLMRSLLWERDWVVVLCSKKKDKTYDEYLAQGYVRTGKWPAPPPPKDQASQHVLLWPKVKTIAELEGMRPVFEKCLDDVFVDEAWCVGLDDTYYLAQKLKLRAQIEALNYQVRALGVSLVSCLQRPAWVPRGCWDQASHAFVRKLSDLDDLRTVRGLSPVSGKELEAWTRQLRQYEWLYLPVAHADAVSPMIVRPPA